MDPEANMKRQIELAREIVSLGEMLASEEPGSVVQQAIAWRGEEIAELVLAMSEWKNKGGA
jgi:hypothetical protein